MFHCFSQVVSFSMSLCMVSWSDCSVMVLWSMVSSAKSRVVELSGRGRSLMYARKREGPSTDPWGTPDGTGLVLDLEPATMTACFLSSRKPSIQASVLPAIPYLLRSDS